MTAVAVPMPGGFVVPGTSGAPASGAGAPQGGGVPPQGGPDAPLPGQQQQVQQFQQPGYHYGQPVPMVPQQAGPGSPQFDAAVQAEVARRAAMQQQQPQFQTQQPQQFQTLPMAEPSKDTPGWLPQNLNQFDVNSLQDPVLRSMGQMIQTVGKDLDLNRVLGNALAHQDPSLIDIAYLVEKGGANASQIAQMAQSLVQSVSAVSARTTQEVYASAGGEAQWNAYTATFNQSAPAAYKQVVAQMLDSGNPAQIQAAAQTIVQYGQQNGRVPVPAQGMGSLPNGGLGGAQGLSAAEFKTQLHALDAGRNTNPNWEQARADLFTQRAIGARMGKQ